MQFKIPSLLKNKYIIVLIAAFVWIVFFDPNNLIQQIRLRNQMNDFNKEIEYYQAGIIRDSAKIQMLRFNPEELERFARENYLMKREGEDIFIIKE